MEIKIWYRLVFKNGHCSAWDNDYNRVKADAKFFNATIERKEVKIN